MDQTGTIFFSKIISWAVWLKIPGNNNVNATSDITFTLTPLQKTQSILLTYLVAEHLNMKVSFFRKKILSSEGNSRCTKNKGDLEGSTKINVLSWITWLAVAQRHRSLWEFPSTFQQQREPRMSLLSRTDPHSPAQALIVPQWHFPTPEWPLALLSPSPGRTLEGDALSQPRARLCPAKAQPPQPLSFPKLLQNSSVSPGCWEGLVSLRE